jgi:MFS family permease
MLPAMFFLGLASIGTATSKNAAAIFITRFFGGVFGSAPVSNVSAALGDIWVPSERGPAVILYSIAVTGGPTIGPIIGAAIIVNPSLGWRWTEYIEAVWVFTTVAVCFFCLPESYSPVLLVRRAKKLRAEGDVNCYHPHEQLKLDFKTIITKHFTRPLLMLATEPTVTCVAFYASFVYGILYLTLEVFPICFQEIREMHPVKASLPFLGLFIGVLSAVFINLANQPRYRRISAAAGGKPVPEARFAPVAFAGFIFVAGLFWFGWTAGDINVSVWHPIVASGLIGCGFNVIFNQCVNVLVDTYGIYAASAVSANTFLRSIMAAGFPLLAKPMLYGMGVGPAISVLGAVASSLIVVPFLFMKYGFELRKRSKMAPV